MNLTEKTAYLKGLADGLELKEDTKEGKILTKILEVLDDVAVAMDELYDEVGVLSEQIDLIDEDLEELEGDYYELDDEDMEDMNEDEYFEITCPKCGDVVFVEDDDMLDDSIKCPGCGAELLEMIKEGCNCEECNGH